MAQLLARDINDDLYRKFKAILKEKGMKAEFVKKQIVEKAVQNYVRENAE